MITIDVIFGLICALCQVLIPYHFIPCTYNSQTIPLCTLIRFVISIFYFREQVFSFTMMELLT